MKIMSLFKLKFAVSVALLLAGGAAVVAISQTSGREELTAQEIVQQAQDAYDALSSYTDTGTVMAETDGVNTKTEFTIRLLRPKSYRVDWVQTKDGRYASRGNIWSERRENFAILATVGKKETYPPRAAHDLQTALAMGAGPSGQASCTIPRIFYSQDYAETLGIPASGRHPLARQKDERIGGVDCHVVKIITDQAARPDGAGNLTTTRTFWIGKLDHLIHQVQTTLSGTSLTETHENIEENPPGVAAYFVQ